MRHLVILLALGLTACATQAKYEAKLQSWIGHPSVDLVQGWGVPQNTISLADGSKAFEYYYGDGTRTVATTTYDKRKKSLDTDSSSYQAYCKTTFFMGPDDKVKTWKWEGNICRSTD